MWIIKDSQISFSFAIHNNKRIVKTFFSKKDVLFAFARAIESEGKQIRQNVKW